MIGGRGFIGLRGLIGAFVGGDGIVRRILWGRGGLGLVAIGGLWGVPTVGATGITIHPLRLDRRRRSAVSRDCIVDQRSKTVRRRGLGVGLFRAHGVSRRRCGYFRSDTEHGRPFTINVHSSSARTGPMAEFLKSQYYSICYEICRGRDLDVRTGGFLPDRQVLPLGEDQSGLRLLRVGPDYK